MVLSSERLSDLLPPLTSGEAVLLIKTGNGQPSGSLLCLNRSKLVILAVRERIPLAWLRLNATLVHGLTLWEIPLDGTTYQHVKTMLENEERRR